MASGTKAAAEQAREDEEARRSAQAQIRQFPDPVLQQRARDVERFDDDLEALAERMIRLMRQAHGAGLAAPQIGLLRRLFVYQAGEDAEPAALVNPEIVEASDETAVEAEGCLSLDVLIRSDLAIPVERPVRVRVRARDVHGEPVERDVEGHEARVIQHELDHLDGTLILDRAAPEARREAMRALRLAKTGR
jgi:peptide deformylase